MHDLFTLGRLRMSAHLSMSTSGWDVVDFGSLPLLHTNQEWWALSLLSHESLTCLPQVCVLSKR